MFLRICIARAENCRCAVEREEQVEATSGVCEMLYSDFEQPHFLDHGRVTRMKNLGNGPKEQ